MPITALRNTARDLTTFECDGDLSFIEIVAVIKRFYRGTIAPRTKKIIWDMRNASIASLTVDHVYHIASLFNEYETEVEATKNAVVVSQGASFDIAKSMEAETKEVSRNLMVFREINKAIEWLYIKSE